MLTVTPVPGLPEIVPGTDLGELVAAATTLVDGDVVVVAQKLVSKAEGAHAWPAEGEDPAAARRRLARDHAARVVADTAGVLIVETRHGFVCANAGIDASNVPAGAFTLLPVDPDASAAAIRHRIRDLLGVDVAVVVSDTFGRPWRVGQTDVAIGVAGLAPLRDDRGRADRNGVVLEATIVAVADELAAAADLVRRKDGDAGVVVIRGFPWIADDGAGARSLVRPASEDLFRTASPPEAAPPGGTS